MITRSFVTEDSNQKPYPLTFAPLIETVKSYDQQSNEFNFLNLKHSFGSQIDWNFEGHGKLWTYNLNYFDCLNQDELSVEKGVALIEDFTNQKESLKDALEPYPTSLRLINWIKFFNKNNIDNSRLTNFLYDQLKHLTKNLEYHLLGNHLLENGFALLFGAVYFRDEAIFALGKQILESELNEQILKDGAHFELSPMYHCIILARTLDTINLLKNNISLDNHILENNLVQHASKMVSWLENIKLGEDQMPLFNDSANGIAPSISKLLTYASDLEIPVYSSELSDSGYYSRKKKQYEFIAKVGRIGPDYIPGHAHSDTFTFVMNAHDNKFIVDTGVSTYDRNELRTYQRSTSAHNTVEVNNKNSSDVWASFRVGKRAKTRLVNKNESSITYSHNGYQSLAGNHIREFLFSDSTVSIKDSLSKDTQLIHKAHLHFEPGVEIKKEPDQLISELGSITFKNASKVELVDCQIAEEFNKLVPSKKAIISFKNNLETIISINPQLHK